MGKVYGLHTLQLNRGVTGEDFERFAASNIKQWPIMPGWRFSLLKATAAMRSGSTLRSWSWRASKPATASHRTAVSRTPTKGASGSQRLDPSWSNGGSTSPRPPGMRHTRTITTSSGSEPSSPTSNRTTLRPRLHTASTPPLPGLQPSPSLWAVCISVPRARRGYSDPGPRQGRPVDPGAVQREYPAVAGERGVSPCVLPCDRAGRITLCGRFDGEPRRLQADLSVTEHEGVHAVIDRASSCRCGPASQQRILPENL